MNVARWVLLLGAGVVLGACGGYSSLGETPAAGGEGDGNAMGGSQSMGAKGGQGHGGTHASGGAQGMGAIGGTGMGAIGGTGMGAIGGTGGDEPVLCMTDADCPPPPPYCALCDDGTPACPKAVCTDSVCGFETPSCSNPEPTRCMTAADCPSPHSCNMCADGSVVCGEGSCEAGVCGILQRSCPETPCSQRACGDPCMAPDGVAGLCDQSGACISGMPNCDAPDTCATDGLCPSDDICLPCSDGSCANTGCVDGRCETVCRTEYMCMTPMDCPKTLSDDPCVTGPWVCAQGACARQYQACMTPN